MMRDTVISTAQTDNTTKGWINGFIGVLLFSGSLPATKVAVMDLSPYFVTAARASIAGVLALLVLLIFKEKDLRNSKLFLLCWFPSEV